MRGLTTVAIVTLVAAGCGASRAEYEIPAGWAAADPPPVERFASCGELWAAGWREGVRLPGDIGDDYYYPPSWGEAQASTYRLNPHLKTGLGVACAAGESYGMATLGYKVRTQDEGVDGTQGHRRRW